MTPNTNNLNKDQYYWTGLIFVFLSFSAFLITPFLVSANDEFTVFSSFIGNYALFLIYFIYLLVENKKKRGKFFAFKDLSKNILLVILGNISAYALNRLIPVFQESTDWLIGFIFLSHLALIWISYRKFNNPIWLNSILLFVIGSNLVFQFYEFIYIAPILPITGISFWFFGISLHALIPLWLLILFSKLTYKAIKESNLSIATIIAGASFPILLLVVFTSRWHSVNTNLVTILEDAKMPHMEAELPSWVKVAQHLENDYVTERILKSGWVYATPTENWNEFGNFNMEKKVHDPFIMSAAFLTKKLSINDNEKALLYGAITNKRHHTERRLWRGNDLITDKITTTVQLMPDHRLAYTEKMFSIHNTHKNSWQSRGFGNNPQEAIYTFYLPEGSVVTSASLWINGEESPSILTTKSKAEKAYTQIVGKERRDPLLVTWQEGNRISARIFPCSSEEDRIFKIGVTTPLKLKGEELIYENIDFKGPAFYNANERINVVVEGTPIHPESNISLKPQNGGFVYDGKYRSDWSLHFPAPVLSNTPFVFNNRAFRAENYAPQLTSFSAKEIYLDINQSWSYSDFNAILKTTKDKKVFAYAGKLQVVTDANKEAIFEQLSNLQFSIFPFHKIKTHNNALVISAYGSHSPSLSELADQGIRQARWEEKDNSKSLFSLELNKALQANESAISVFHIGQKITPYMKTLKEIRSINLHRGTTSDLVSLLENKQFPSIDEATDLVRLENAGMILREISATNQTSSAPDHLMRLFVYNDLMKKIGRNYFHRDSIQNDLIEAASEVTVLSPVSSFVTLETQEDYDRFDIKNNENGLKNAGFDSSGSVPEPHEWAMILMFLFFVLWQGWEGFNQRIRKTLR